MIKIAPSVLAADFSKMGDEVAPLKEYGADFVHCDVMDGRFVPNITFGMPMVKAIKSRTELPLDVHLMIEEPEKYVDAFIDAGAKLLTFHHTATKRAAEIIERIKARGVKAGIALNPDVPLSSVAEFIGNLDMLLIMSVFAGFGGQSFIPGSIDRLLEAGRLKQAYNGGLIIEIDGGINLDNIRSVEAAGADIAVAGSCIFGAADRRACVRALKGA